MKVNGYRADDLVGVGLVTRQRWVIPLWMSMLGAILRGVARLVVWLVRRGAFTGPALVLLIAYLRYGWQGPAWISATVAVILTAWWWSHRSSFVRFVVAPWLGQWRLLIRYRRLWRPDDRRPARRRP